MQQPTALAKLNGVSKLKSLNKLMTAAVCASLVTACTTPPRTTYDTTSMSAIKTIAVATPKKTTYYAISAGSGGAVLIGGGILASVIATAVTNAVTAGRSNVTFNDLVTEKVGDTGLNRKFVDALEGELKDAGYEVKEVDLSGDDMPKVSVRRDGTQVLTGKAYAGADAIMVVENTNGYFAAGSFSWYTRDARVHIAMYKADTHQQIFNEQLHFNKGNSDSYHYTMYGALKDDLPHAIQGLDEAVMGLVPDFKADLLASRGVSAKTMQTVATSEPVQKAEGSQKVETAQKPETSKAE